MPCQHELCMPCFRQNVEKANLTCPMCRLRISNWARKHSGRLINEQRWKSIQEAFPELCQKRMETGEEGDDDVLDLMTQPPPPIVHVAEPGEIGEEFKKETEKVKEEYRRELEEAVKQSEEYIKVLQKEEVRRFEERQEEILSQEKQDAELARQLAQEGPDTVIHRGEKVHVMREQVLKDEELARRLQMSEQSLSGTPIPKSPDVVVIHSSGGSSRNKNRSSSSIKCLSIERFLSPSAGRRSKSPERKQLSWEISALEDQPSTSACSPGIHVSEDTNSSPPLEKQGGKPRGAFSPVTVLKAPRLMELEESHLRAHSTDSNDSISGEMNHFKPIHVSPRTAHRKLPDGRAESPPIVFTTPRNLKKMEEEAASGTTSAQMSSMMKARWKDLETERSSQVQDSSKSTMTSLARHLKKQLSRQHTSKQVRPGDRGDRQVEPPHKKARVVGVVSAAGDGPRVTKDAREQSDIDEHKGNGGGDRLNTLFQMSGVKQGKSSVSPGVCDDEAGDFTDYNHNCNNSRLMDAKVKSSPSGRFKLDEDANVSRRENLSSSVDATSVEVSQKRAKNGLNGVSGTGKDEVDGLSKPPRKKVQHTPIKVYAMREQTKLQTRVTNSIKDLFNAKRAKSKNLEVDSAMEKSDPPLPSLERLEEGEGSSVDMLRTGVEESGSSNGRDKESILGKSQRKNLSPFEATSTRSANGSESAVNNQRSNDVGNKSRRKAKQVEVSYRQWLSSNGCKLESMQNDVEATGNSVMNDSSKHDVCEASNSNSQSKCRGGKMSSNNGTNGTICDDGLSQSERDDSSRIQDPSSQDSDVSMASIDCEDKYSGKSKNKSNGESRKRDKGKAKPAKGVGSSRKSPRKSGDTILRYMELLNEEQRRLSQEEKDRLLAERLQNEFDRESRKERDNVDRSKGTEDAYELRMKERPIYNYME